MKSKDEKTRKQSAILRIALLQKVLWAKTGHLLNYKMKTAMAGVTSSSNKSSNKLLKVLQIKKINVNFVHF